LSPGLVAHSVAGTALGGATPAAGAAGFASSSCRFCHSYLLAKENKQTKREKYKENIKKYKEKLMRLLFS
jgi:cytochrome c5